MVNLFFFGIISAILTFLIFLIVYVINISDGDYDKKSAYECGFEPFGDARSFFDVQFYIIGLLFVIFDLEVVFLIPLVADVENISLFGYINAMLFVFVILLGFYYEWSLGLLNWVSQQKSSSFFLSSYKNTLIFFSINNVGQDLKHYLLLPELIMFFLFLVFLFIVSFFDKNEAQARLKRYFPYINKGILLILLCTCVVLKNNNYADYYYFAESYKVNIWSQCLKVLVFSLVVIIIYFSNLKIKPVVCEVFLLLYLIALFSFILFSCRLFPLQLITLEGISLISYYLAMAEKTYGGFAAAVKYFTMGTLGSIFLFWGVIHMYNVVSSLTYASIFDFIDNKNVDNLKEIEFFSKAYGIGALIKLGAAPFHLWIPDNYAGVSVFTNMIFALLIKTIFFLTFFEVFLHLFFDEVIKISMLLSLLIGCYFSLRQSELRRLIAYSSIVHTSFLLAGDAVAALIYLLTYLISNIFFFYFILAQQKAEQKQFFWLNDLGALNSGENIAVIGFGVSLMSMAGLPPFAGFYGKFFVWVSLLEHYYIYNDIYMLLFFIVSIFFSLLIILYYARIVLNLFVRKKIDSIIVTKDVNEFNRALSTLHIRYLVIFFILGWSLIEKSIMTLLLFLISTL